MISLPSGSVLVKKVDGNNNFIEDDLQANDIPVTTTGTSYSEVSYSGTNIQTLFDNTTKKFRKNHYLIKSLSDFPTPTGNVITLNTNSIYEINGVINLSTNSIKLASGVMLKGESPLSDGLIYSGTSIGLLASGISCEVSNLHLSSPVSGSSLFSYSGSNSNHNQLDLKSIYFSTNTGEETYSVGQILGGEFINISDCHFINCRNGFTISGTVDQVFIENNIIQDCIGSTFKAFDFSSGSNFQTIQFLNNYIDLSSGQVGINAPNTLVLSGGFIVEENSFIGGTAVSGGLITSGNVYFIAGGNFGLADTREIGFIRWDQNTTVTVIGNTTTYYVASGTNSFTIAERFDCSVDNRIKYIGEFGQQNFNVLSTGSVFVATNNQTCRVALWKFNSSTSTSSQISEVEVRCITGGQPESFAINEILTLNKNDYLEIRVRNITNTQNITVNNMQFRVTK